MHTNFRQWKNFNGQINLMAAMFLLVALIIMFGLAYGKEIPVKYSQVRIYLTSKNDILTLQRAGLVFDHIDYQNTYFETVLNNQEVDLLKKTAWPYDIVIDDLEAEYRRRPQFSQAQMSALEAEMKDQYGVTGFNFGSMGGYYTFSEVVAELDEMRSLFPNLISVKQSIGNSIEGRTIWMVKISDNPSIDESEEEVLYTALHHAREPQSMATVIYFMWHLLENYGTDPDVAFLVQNRELYFIPVVNPDGYVYNETTNPNGGGFWRKNRRNNGGGIFGVDLNRNYGYQWGFDNNGSSPSPSSDTYRGTAAFSEPETQVIRDFAINHSFTRAFNYHSYGNLLIFPWGYIPNFFTPDHALFVAFAQDMTQFNNYTYGTANQTVGYVVNGEANDWFYGEQTLKDKVIAFTPEVGSGSDGFWPSQSRIIPLADENVYPNLVLAMGLSSPPLPNVTVTLTPTNPPITIPPSGGSFSFTAKFTNNSASSQTFQIWNLLNLPNGNTFGPTIGPKNVTLATGQSLSRSFTQNIPAGAPAGQYTYNFYVGTYPSTIIDSDNFTFTKSSPVVTAEMATLLSLDDWPGFDTNVNQVVDDSKVPEKFRLNQNYPNPFNPSTRIDYGLKTDSRVTLKIYNTNGQEIVTLVDERQRAGYKTVIWDGRNKAGESVASGVYIYKMVAGTFVQVRKMLFWK